MKTRMDRCKSLPTVRPGSYVAQPGGNEWRASDDTLSAAPRAAIARPNRAYRD